MSTSLKAVHIGGTKNFNKYSIVPSEGAFGTIYIPRDLHPRGIIEVNLIASNHVEYNDLLELVKSKGVKVK